MSNQPPNAEYNKILDEHMSLASERIDGYFENRNFARKGYLTLACCLTLILTACGNNEKIPKEVTEQVAVETVEGPEFDLLVTPVGNVNFPVSCNAQAMPLIERGVALLHHMMYEESQFLFRMADNADPDCAMAYWGQAMTIIHPLWPDVSSPAALERGLALVEKAASIGGNTDRENGYLRTTAAYFEKDDSLNERARLEKFEDAWKQVSDENSEDLEARAFYSLSLIATANNKEEQLRKAGLLAISILDEAKDHPGAHHYIIHSYDTPALAELAEATADNYGTLTPRVPHATHMMTHTYTRLGQWDKAITWNRISAETALALCIATGEVNLHYTHALDYLAYAYLQKGEDMNVQQVLADADELKPPYSPVNRDASAYAFSALPARFALERRDWDAAADLQPRVPASFPWVKGYDQYVAITHFARAIGLSRLGRPDEAQADIDTLKVMQSDLEGTSPYWSKQVEIQASASRAWQTYARGDKETGILLLKQAADLEATTDKNAVTPGEVLPVAELYGDMLLENGRDEDALAAYRVALVRSPGRFNSLFGAGKAAYNSGDMVAAGEYFSELLSNTANADETRTQLVEARSIMNEI